MVCRRLTGIGGSSRIDHRLGRYLLYTTATFDRDDQANWLRAHRIEFLALHQLEDAVGTLRSVPRRRWIKLESQSGYHAAARHP